MATLLSEDKEVISSLGIIAKEVEENQGQHWQRYALLLKSNDYTISLDGGGAGEDCLLCRQPEDEVEQLTALIQGLLDGERELALFEPAEPSFELLMQQASNGIKVEVWLDSGNAKTGIYSWDAVGIRFFTSRKHLTRFLHDLREEFAC